MRTPSPPQSLASYAQGWSERARATEEADRRWRAQVLSGLPDALAILARDFGVTRALLFGSFARDTAAPGSDLDLLVDGLAVVRLLEATAAANRPLPHVDLDLVPRQIARREVLARAEQEGRVVYER